MAWVKIKRSAYDLIVEADQDDQLLRRQLDKAEKALNALVCSRERAIRRINGDKWDKTQFLLDDLQQKLSDISEELAEIAPIESIIENLIAP